VPVAVVDSLEIVHVHHEKGQGIVLEGVPGDVLLEVVVQEAAIVETREFVLEDQAGGIFSDDLEMIQ
jgi:hypothetical protein